MQVDFRRNKPEEGSENQFYYHQDSLRGRGLRGRPRGVLRGEERGGPFGGLREAPCWGPVGGRKGYYREVAGYGHQYQAEQRNSSTQGNLAEDRSKRGPGRLYRERSRGGPWIGSAQGQGGDEAFIISHNGGWWPYVTHHGPVYLEDVERDRDTYRSNDNLGFDPYDFGEQKENEKTRQNRENQTRSKANRERGQGGMEPAHSMSSLQTNQSPRNQNHMRFEHNELVVCGLSVSTTDEGVLNFIEAISGEEVKEVSMLGKAKALVTMAQPISGKCNMAQWQFSLLMFISFVLCIKIMELVHN